VQTGKSCNNETPDATHMYAYPGAYGMALTITDRWGLSVGIQTAIPACLGFSSRAPTRSLALADSRPTSAGSDVANDSSGTTQLIIDVFGHFSSN
jgi:hypothetical protein